MRSFEIVGHQVQVLRGRLDDDLAKAALHVRQIPMTGANQLSRMRVTQHVGSCVNAGAPLQASEKIEDRAVGHRPPDLTLPEVDENVVRVQFADLVYQIA